MGRSESARTKNQISEIMRKVRSTNTTAEVVFRKALWAKGLRYKVCPSNIPGKPDVVFPSARLAIFIDGDFWHGGQWRKRKLTTLEDQFKESESKYYWVSKIKGNMARDCATTQNLLAEGWTVLRFWESQLRENLEKYVEITIEAVRAGVEPSPYSIIPQRTAAEFFAGIGLVRMGLERQGWYIAFANDIDEQKHEMYSTQFQDNKEDFVIGDIHKLVPDQIPTVTLATASFPCNDLSLAGARNGLNGKKSSAFWGFVNVLEQMGDRRPPLVLLENVTGFLTSHKGEDFKEALNALNRLGYDVDSFILDASNFVPQSRQRLFVVGILNVEPESLDMKKIFQITSSTVRPGALVDFILGHPEIRWKIRDLPPPPWRENRLQDVLEDFPEGSPAWWSKERAEYLLSQMSSRHRTIAERMISAQEYSYGTVFRRVRNGKTMAELRTDSLAGCLRTPRGGSARQILFKAGKGKYFARLLTPRECARLMGADDYIISVPTNQALFGFGDAVCVPVIEWIAESYLNPVVNELIRGYQLRL